MAQEQVPVNGDINRVRAYIVILKDIWNTFGLPTLLLVFIISVWMGWVSSPLGEAQDDMRQIKWMLKKHVALDNEQVFYARRLCMVMSKVAKADPEDCVWHSPEQLGVQ